MFNLVLVTVLELIVADDIRNWSSPPIDLGVLSFRLNSPGKSLVRDFEIFYRKKYNPLMVKSSIDLIHKTISSSKLY